VAGNPPRVAGAELTGLLADAEAHRPADENTELFVFVAVLRDGAPRLEVDDGQRRPLALDRLWEQEKIRVDRRKLSMSAIKRIGRYPVPLELFPDVTVELKVVVAPEGQELPPEEELVALEAAEAEAEAAAAEAAERETEAAEAAQLAAEAAAEEAAAEEAAARDAASSRSSSPSATAHPRRSRCSRLTGPSSTRARMSIASGQRSSTSSPAGRRSSATAR